MTTDATALPDPGRPAFTDGAGHAAQAVRTDVARPHVSGSDSESAARRLRVLVIDDEPIILEVVSAYLGVDGHVAETASNGVEALREFHSGSFDLVITDRAMPGMSGDVVAATIKHISPATPIILLTGFGGLMNAEGDRPSAIDIVLHKPVTLRALRAAVAALT